MKAIRVHEFGGPQALVLEEVPEPEPAAGQVRVGVKAIGVNPVETYLRSGSNPALPRPYTPGTDAAGVVERLGEDVSGFAPGDRVYTSGALTGTYAEQVVCRSADVHALPDHLTFEQGAGINIPYATAWRALVQRAGVQKGETVLIHGATGGVGIAASQLARTLGLVAIGTGGTERGRQLALENGITHCLDHTQEGYLRELEALTGGRGPDVILEMLSNVNLGRDAEIIAPRGRIIIIGCRGRIEINPRDLMIREADMRGVMLFNATADEVRGIHDGLRDGLNTGTLQPVIGRTFELSEAAEAHRAVLAPGAFGKIVLLPRGGRAHA
jgi:NADPH2:quinone reductase